MVHYKLVYFNARGRAEVTRLLFRLADVPFDDVRIEKEKWPELKPKTPFGGLPYIEIDGKAYGQSKAIQRYIADELGLGGKTNLEKLQIDAVIEALSDVQNHVAKLVFKPDGPEKEEAKQSLKKDIIFPQFARLNALCGANGHFVGDSITLADLGFFQMHCQLHLVLKIKHEPPEGAHPFPHLQKVVQTIHANERIAKWLKERPQTNF